MLPSVPEVSRFLRSKGKRVNSNIPQNTIKQVKTIVAKVTEHW
jgi:hypothetical protein